MEHDELIIKPKRPKGEDGYKVFSVRIKDDTVARVERSLPSPAEAATN